MKPIDVDFPLVEASCRLHQTAGAAGFVDRYRCRSGGHKSTLSCLHIDCRDNNCALLTDFAISLVERSTARKRHATW